MTYPYPPLTPTDPDELARRLAQSLGDAWDDVQARYQAVLLSANQRRKAAVLQTLAELLASVSSFQARVVDVAEDYARTQLPAAYAAGALGVDPAFSWTQPHLAAAQALAADGYDDLLRRSVEAGRTSEAFARHVRREVRSRAAFAVTAGKTAVQVGEELRARLEAQGVTAATYANGRVVSMRTYTEMAVRTKTGVAHNLGALNSLAGDGIGWVEVFDGADCGWTGHDDPDKANGTVRKVAEAQAHLLSHPNCRRAFGARPDITSAKQARTATPSTTAAQREDQAAFEQEQAATRARQAARRRRQERRQQRLG